MQTHCGLWHLGNCLRKHLFCDPQNKLVVIWLALLPADLSFYMRNIGIEQYSSFFHGRTCTFDDSRLWLFVTAGVSVSTCRASDIINLLFYFSQEEGGRERWSKPEKQLTTSHIMSGARRSRGGGQQEASSQTNGRRAADRAAEMAEEEEGGAGPSGFQEEDDDPARRRELRSRYRDLINNVQRE